MIGPTAQMLSACRKDTQLLAIVKHADASAASLPPSGHERLAWGSSRHHALSIVTRADGIVLRRDDRMESEQGDHMYPTDGLWPYLLTLWPLQQPCEFGASDLSGLATQLDHEGGCRWCKVRGSRFAWPSSTAWLTDAEKNALWGCMPLVPWREVIYAWHHIGDGREP